MKLLRMVKNFFVAIVLLLFFLFPLIPQVSAQRISQTPPKTEFMKAEIISVESTKPNPESNYHSSIETLDVVIQDGADAGKTTQVQYDTQGISNLVLNVGDTVILTKIVNQSGQATYSVESKYRLAPLSLITVVFIILVVLIVGWKSIGSF